MIRTFWLVFLSVPLLVFQAAFLENSIISIKGIVPDLYFLVVVFIALYGPKDKVYLFNWLMGLMRDCTSETALGTSAILYMAITFLIVLIRDLIVKENVVFQFVTVFVAALIPNTLYGLSLVYFYQPYSAFFIISRSILIAFYTALAAPFFYLFLYSLKLNKLR